MTTSTTTSTMTKKTVTRVSKVSLQALSTQTKHLAADEEVYRLVDEKPISRNTRRFLWVFSVMMLLITGIAFFFKLFEFAYSFTSDQSLRFAILPVMTYLIVAAGFACLFFWAYLSGHFKNVEAPKYRMLQMQEEIDAREGY